MKVLFFPILFQNVDILSKNFRKKSQLSNFNRGFQ